MCKGATVRTEERRRLLTGARAGGWRCFRREKTGGGEGALVPELERERREKGASGSFSEGESCREREVSGGEWQREREFGRRRGRWSFPGFWRCEGSAPERRRKKKVKGRRRRKKKKRERDLGAGGE